MPAEEATTQVASFMGLSSTSKASIDGPQFTAVSGVSGVSTAEPQQKSPVSEPAETVEQSLHKKRAFISNQQKHSEIRQQYKEMFGNNAPSGAGRTNRRAPDHAAIDTEYNHFKIERQYEAFLGKEASSGEDGTKTGQE